jgi:hypothetical protein
MPSDTENNLKRIKELKNDFATRQVGDDRILLPVKQNMSDFNAMFTLNATAAYLWNQLDEAEHSDDLVKALQQQYEVDGETAGADVKAFIIELHKFMSGETSDA